MKVFVVWFENIDGSRDLVNFFSTEEGAKAYIKLNSTFGNEGLYWEEYEVDQ